MTSRTALGLRPAAITSAPASAAARTAPRPMPLVPPTTTTRWPRSGRRELVSSVMPSPSSDRRRLEGRRLLSVDIGEAVFARERAHRMGAAAALHQLGIARQRDHRAADVLGGLGRAEIEVVLL